MLTLVFAVAFSLAGDERNDLVNAIREAELKLELSKRSIPPSFDPEKEGRFISEVAKRLGFGVDMTVLNPPETVGELMLHRLEVSGPDTNLGGFLSILAARDFRAGDLETLHADGKRFTARFVLPVHAPSERSRDLRQELERIRGTQAAIDRLNWSRLRDTAAVLNADRPRTVHVSAVDVDDGVSLEGVLAGAAARKEFLASLAKAGFAVTRLRMSPSGACRAFALTARRGSGEMQSAFDLAPSPLCRADAEPAAGRIAAGGSDGLTLRFRNIDLADFFFVLHDLSGENFVVDADVKGAVDVDVENAKIEDVLAASGFVVGPGPLHRVSRPSATPLQSKDYAGEPVSLVFSDVLLRDVLCLYKEITGLDFHTAPGLATRANVYVKNRPWDETLDMLLAAAGLRYTIDGTRVLVGDEATVSACEGFGSSSFSDLRPKLDELAVADLTLAGVAGRKAYVYGPFRKLLVLEPGTRVFDGAVKSITTSGVRFAMDRGPVFDLPL